MAVRQGPCAAPGCRKPATSSQWTFIPPGFMGETAEGHNGCLCKSDNCRAHFGHDFGLPPLTVAGKKRAAAAGSVPVAQAVGQSTAQVTAVRLDPLDICEHGVRHQ